MDLQLLGKTAIVTGGSAGMGKAIAHQLAREGCDVAIGARTEAPLRAAALEITKETGRKIVSIVVDTLDGEAIEQFIRQAAEALGGIHILANCAARSAALSPIIWIRSATSKSSKTSKRNSSATIAARAKLRRI